jgi:hypothetical protein
MMLQPDIPSIERRVKRYWYTDGIGEIAGGGLFVMVGLYFGLQGYLGEDSLLTTVLQASLVLVIVGGTFAARWMVNLLKTRLTYPRTGYVEYRRSERNSRSQTILVALIGMGMAVSAVLIAYLLGSPDLVVAMTGIIIGFVLAIVVGRTSGSIRFYLLGMASFFLGLILSFSGMPQDIALAWYYALMGFVTIASGGFALGRFLRQNPPPLEVGSE